MSDLNIKMSKVVYVSVYESLDPYLNCTVHLPDESAPLILVLNSYKALNWKIRDDFNNKIEMVLVNHYGGSSTVVGHGQAPIHSILGLSGHYDDYANALAYLKSSLGSYPYFVKIQRQAKEIYLSRVAEHYVVGAFSAEYYSHTQRIDGAFPRYCEKVDSLALKIEHARTQYGLPAQSFYGIWRSNIEVLAQQRTVVFNFNVKGCYIRFYLDGKLLNEWSAHIQQIELELCHGSHKIEVRCIGEENEIELSLDVSDELAYV